MPEKKPKKGTLHLRNGVEYPGSINQDAVERFRKQKKKILSAGEFVKGILSGDKTILSQAITLIESSLAVHQQLAADIIEACLPFSGKSIRIGITGVPGVGKSTFIEALGTNLTRQGKKLAVLAIDPSSERSGGSILGDKTRMEILSTDPNAFIRPSPSGGSLGGVARKTRETIILCEAAGFDTIFIETVGVGQSESTVHSMVDFFLLLMLAGAGDELQGIKRGIMEMADALAITKADGTNLDKALKARQEYQNALHLYPRPESGWPAKVIICSALNNTGIEEIWDVILEYLDFVESGGYFQTRRSQQARYWMYAFIDELLRTDFYNHPDIRKRLHEMEQRVIHREITSFHAAREVMGLYLGLKKY